MWLGIPLFKLCKYTIFGTDTDIPNRLWFSTAVGVTGLLVAGFLYFCPSPSVVTAPVVIDFEPLAVVRSNASGFAKTIHVTDGQWVKKGDLLVHLENPDLQHELDSLLIDIKISDLRSNALFNEGRIAEVQLEQSSLESMIKRKNDLEERIADLHVVAPQDGAVIARDLDSKQGKYFQPGTEILSIGDPDEVKAIALTRQSDIEWLESSPDASVDLLIWGRHQSAVIQGKIHLINPRARDDLPHDAFAASAGGPLPVVPRSQVQTTADASDNEMVLTEPRVTVEINVGQKYQEQLVPGQTGQMHIRSRHENMAAYLANNFVRFVRANNYRTHGL